LETIKELYDLPHMRMRYVWTRSGDFCDDDEREAEKAYRRALAERNKRLNAAAKTGSRARKKQV